MGDLKIEKPELDLEMPSVPNLEVSDKSTKFSFGFGKKGKKKKGFDKDGDVKAELALPSVNSDLDINTPDHIDTNFPKVDLEGTTFDADIKKSEVDLGEKLPSMDIKIPSSDLNLDSKVPSLDVAVSKPEIDVDFTSMSNVESPEKSSKF